MAAKQIDMERFKQQVEAFSQVREVYEVFSEVLQAVLKQMVRDLGLEAIVQVRAKTVPSFAGKVIRKQDRYPDAVNQLTDLCGGRVITACTDDIPKICEFIRRHFEIDEANSEDVVGRLGSEKFGYRSVHYIVSLKLGELEDLLEKLISGRKTESERETFRLGLRQLLERRSPEEAARLSLSPGPRHKAEIQVRSLLQHAWAALSHDRVYKAEFDVPARFQRDINRIAATLEEADDAFARTIRQVDGLKTYHGAYMGEDQLRYEEAKLEAVLAHDPDNRRLALEAARLARKLGAWDRVCKHLEPFVARWNASVQKEQLVAAYNARRRGDTDEREAAQERLATMRDAETAQLLLEHGVALWRSGPRAGRDDLEWALELAPQLVDASVALGRTYLDDRDPKTALPYFQTGVATSPPEPRALGGLVLCKALLERDLGFVPLLRPTLEAAIDVCGQRAVIGVDLPRVYFDSGFFQVLLGRPYEALASYAKAVVMTTSEDLLDRRMEELRELSNALGDRLPDVRWVMTFLSVARAGWFVRQLGKARVQLEAALETEAAARTEATAKAADEARRSVEDLTRGLDRVRRELAAQRVVETSVFEEPIVIVAGGTHASVEGQIAEYRHLVLEAFEGFSGTVFSGGTRSGICGIVGDLPEPEGGRIRKVAYLPKYIPSWATKHPAYEFHQTKGERFSPADPLQIWIDLLASGADPTQVKLIGINGGKLSAFETALALVMGAKVALLRDSGRAANEVLADDRFCSMDNLIDMPCDANTLGLFLRESIATTTIPQEVVESLAEDIHAQYRREQWNKKTTDRALAEWNDLPEDLKSSSRGQAAHIEAKLRAVGMTLRKAEHEPIIPIELSPGEIEVMAEIEHGRWNAERLLAGWKRGERDVGKKTSPHLVSWAELPDSVREYDRKFVREIPARLAKLGYEIVRAKG
jgi:ppGpp synthetase/RelA/SpoT-type nucleotidyltranferase